jgi:hypothetical protein
MMPLTDASQIPCNHVHFFLRIWWAVWTCRGPVVWRFGGLCGRAGGLLFGDLVGCVDVRVCGRWWGPDLFP